MPSAYSTHWQLRSRRLQVQRRPLLMGIVNVTPDSFSDGGKHNDTDDAVRFALRLAAEGADLLDIGGQSTRPFSSAVSLEEELRRVMPVVRALASRTDVPLSIDTSKAEVARQAIEAGAEVINDITGLEGDPAMLEVARESKAGICLMHMQGTPATMQQDPQYGDVVAEVESYLAARRDAALAAGVVRERICLDVGVGFGKTLQHNLELLRSIRRFHGLGCPLLVGHSRKGFIGKVLGDKSLDPTWGGTGVALAMAQAGVQVLRVHEIAPLRDALALWEAVGGSQSEGARDAGT